MAHAVISAKNAAVTDDTGTPVPFSGLSNIQITESHAESTKGALSNSNGAPLTTMGAADLLMRADFSNTVPPYFPGETVNIEAWNGNSSDDAVLTGPMMTEEFSLNIDMAGSAIIDGTVALGLNATSSLTYAKSVAGTSIDTSAVTGVVSAKGTRIETGASLAATTKVEDWQRSNFTIRIGTNPRSIDTGFTARTAGNISASGSYTVLEADPALRPAAGDVIALKQYVTATAFYGFEFIRIASVEEVMNIESGEPVGYTVNWTFTAANDSGTMGQILKPDQTNFWQGT